MTFSSFPETNDEQHFQEVPLADALYGASFIQAVSRFFKKYARFKGYASRSEYWWVFLFNILVSIVISVIEMATNDTVGSVLNSVYGLAILVPSLALGWRRMHDAGFAGPWYLLTYASALIGLLLIILGIGNPAIIIIALILVVVGGITVFILTLLPTRPEKHRSEWDDPESSRATDSFADFTNDANGEI